MHNAMYRFNMAPRNWVYFVQRPNDTTETLLQRWLVYHDPWSRPKIPLLPPASQLARKRLLDQ
jgi:hypothetical protein